MELTTLVFDSRSKEWEDDRNQNHLFLLCTERYINDAIRVRGYIYLNQIYELLDIKWNPDKNNPCVKNDGVDRIMFVQFEVFDRSDNSCCIVISRYD